MHVNQPGNQILAYTALTGDQNLRIATGRTPGERLDFRHLGTCRHEERHSARELNTR
jgi:hypothetical protein